MGPFLEFAQFEGLFLANNPSACAPLRIKKNHLLGGKNDDGGGPVDVRFGK